MCLLGGVLPLRWSDIAFRRSARLAGWGQRYPWRFGLAVGVTHGIVVGLAWRLLFAALRGDTGAWRSALNFGACVALFAAITYWSHLQKPGQSPSSDAL